VAVTSARDPAAILGNELRWSRQRCRKVQRVVAGEIGCSQSTISRMELGRGGAMSLSAWAAAAGAVDRRLVVELVPRDSAPRSEEGLARRCHGLVTELARDGGWTAVTEIITRPGRADIETVLTRRNALYPHRPEVAVVHVWDLLTEPIGRFERMRISLARERQERAADHVVAGLVVMPARADQRRRATEERALLQVEYPALAAHWFGALVNGHRRMPTSSGILWCDRAGERFLPAPLVPGWVWLTPDHAPAFMSRPGG
jgi:hypothetical protein